MELEMLARGALLLSRPGMLIVSAPVFGGRFSPPHVRAGLALLLALLLLPAVPLPPLSSVPAIGVAIARELAIGLALGLGLRALVAGAELGGHLAGSQLMLSYGSTIDPQGGVRSTLMATLYGNLALVTFLVVNGHHALLRELVASYSALPIGSGGIDDSLAASVAQLLGVTFTFGLKVAAPVLVVMLLVEVAAGLVSKTLPAINLMAVAGPVKVLIGLIAISAVIGVLPDLVARTTSTIAALSAQLARAFE